VVVGGRGLLTLFQSSYKNFKGSFLKIQASPQKPDLLEGFPLYWTQNPNLVGARQLGDLESQEREHCLLLEQLKTIFETKQVLSYEYQPANLKLYIGLYSDNWFFCLFVIVLPNSCYIPVESRMGMSKQDLARRLKSIRAPLLPRPAVGEVLTRATETLQISSDDKETVSESGLKRRRRGLVTRVPAEAITTLSQSRPEQATSSIGSLHLEGSSSGGQSFWDSSYQHVSHSLAHNVFEGDLQCLLNQDLSSVQEDICAFLHKAEVSTIALCKKLNQMNLIEEKKNKEISAAKVEIARLNVELVEYENLKRKLKEEETRSAELGIALKEAMRKSDEIEVHFRRLEMDAEEKEKSWCEQEEKMANEAATTYGVGFEAALEQVRLLCPTADLSGVDAEKVVIDGNFVDG